MAEEARIFLGTDIKALRRGFKNAIKEAKAFNKTLEGQRQQYRKTAIASGIAFAAIGAGILSVVKPAKTLQDNITQALTLVDEQGPAFEAMALQMEKDAIDLSKKLGISASDIAAGFYNVLSTGAQAGTEGFIQLTETAVKMAKVTKLEMGRTVEILSDTVAAFNLTLEDSARVADVFFKASKKVTVTVPQLAEAFREAGAVSATMNIPIEETVAILDAFAQKGTKAADAGTLFKIMVAGLTSETPQATKALDDLGIEIEDSEGNLRSIIDIMIEMKAATQDMGNVQKIQTLTMIFGRRAAARMGGILAGNLEVMKEWKQSFSEGTGINEAFNKKLQTLTGQIGLMKANLEAVIIPLGKAFIPAIIKAMQWVTKIAQQMGPWIAANAKLLAVLAGGGAFAAGLIASVSAFGLALTFLPAAIAAATGPIGLLVAGALALAGALTFLALRQEAIPTSAEGIDDAWFENEKQLRALKAQVTDTKDEMLAAQDAVDMASGSYRSSAQEALKLKASIAELEERSRKLIAAKLTLQEVENQEAATKKLLKELQDALNTSTETGIALSVQKFVTDAAILDMTITFANNLRQIFVEDIPELWFQMAGQYNDALVTMESASERATRNMASAFFSLFDRVSDAEKNFVKATLKTLGLAITATIRAEIQRAVGELLVTKVKEIGKATVEAPGTLGASLLRIPAILAAAGAGIAAVRAIEKRIAPSFLHGGISPGGLVQTEPGEIMFNPQTNTLADLAGMLGQSGVGDVNVFSSHFGPISGIADAEALGRAIGEEFRSAAFGFSR